MTLPVRLPLAMRSRPNIYFYLQQFIGPPVADPSPRVHLPKISPLYTPLRLPISPLSLSPSDPLHLLQRQARNTGDMRQNTQRTRKRSSGRAHSGKCRFRREQRKSGKNEKVLLEQNVVPRLVLSNCHIICIKLSY